jgi:hypothetical protein
VGVLMCTTVSACWLDLAPHRRRSTGTVMSRPTAAAALAALVALVVTWLLLGAATVPYHHLVTPQPTYLAGRLVSMLTG